MPEAISRKVTVKVFGFLRRRMDELGLPYEVERHIPRGGCAAHEVARQIGLPPEDIEAVFRNGVVVNLYDTVEPGDRIGFFPPGTPGPYRALLGIARENTERRRRESR